MRILSHFLFTYLAFCVIIQKAEESMILEKVKKMIADQLCISLDEVKEDSNIMEDLGADSLDIVELLMSFEDEFKVSIPDEKVSELKTVGQIVKIIEEYTK